MIDQTRVQSGFDVEVLLGPRYLQHLLLLAVDVGLIPTAIPFDGDTLRLREPASSDRTYPFATGSEPPIRDNREDPLRVEVLTGDPRGADLKVTVLVEPNPTTAALFLDLFFALDLDTEPAADGGLGVVTLRSTLLDVEGSLVDAAAMRPVPVTRAEIVARVAPYVDRSFDLGSTGSGGRLERLALRKLPGDADHDPALGLYLNLRLRKGPRPDAFLDDRGVVAGGLNFLDTGLDCAFATRADLYDVLGPDAKYRRAEETPFGFRYPVYEHPATKEGYIGKIDEIEVGPRAIDGALKIAVAGEVSVDYLPNPGYTITAYLSGVADGDDVLGWDSDSSIDTGLLADLVLGLVSLAFVPLLGPHAFILFMALELAKEVTEAIVAEAVIDDKVQDRVDAGVLDVAPNRFTVVRRRWDPFYETHHQLGLRPGDVDANDDGIVLSGPAVLTRQPQVVRGSVIREAVRDDAGVLTGLGYRVGAPEPWLALRDVVAPATDRRELLPAGTTTDPDLVALSVDEALDRLGSHQLEGLIEQVVVRVEMTGGSVTGLLLLSAREHRWLRADLLAGKDDEVRTRVVAAETDRIRAEVVQELDDQGIIATPEQIEAEVTARIDLLVAEEVAAYEAGALADDLAAAADLAATLVLSPDEAGRLQEQGVLTVLDFAAVHVAKTDRWYFRDRYVASLERTPAKRLADNLVRRPRFRREEAGLVRL